MTWIDEWCLMTHRNPLVHEGSTEYMLNCERNVRQKAVFVINPNKSVQFEIN